MEQVLSPALPGKPAEHVRALVATAAQQATTKPGLVDFIKLLSPVSQSATQHQSFE